MPFYRITKNHQSPNRMTVSGVYIKIAFTNLSDALTENNTKLSLYWLSELLGSGLIEELWTFVFDFYAMYVHYYYPNMIVYILEKHKDYLHMKRVNEYSEIRNNLNIREYFYRIIYIYSTLNKRHLLGFCNNQSLFQSFRTTPSYKHLLKGSDEPNKDMSEEQAREMMSFINSKSHSQIENALAKFKHNLNILHQHPKNKDHTKHVIYTWLSFLLEKGTERFGLYQYSSYVHLKHCQDRNKYSYFIWIIWNALLEQSAKSKMKYEIQSLYSIYVKYKNDQSIPAYYLIIAACVLFVEGSEPKNIYIDNHKYIKNKTYFYTCFGFIQEALSNNTKRRDA